MYDIYIYDIDMTSTDHRFYPFPLQLTSSSRLNKASMQLLKASSNAAMPGPG